MEGRMRRLFLCALTAALAGCGSGIAAQSAGTAMNTTAASSAANADPYSFSFGSIPGTRAVSHDFIIENKGSKDVRITGKTNSCGCMSSKIDKEVIPPGQSARVTAVFDPKGYSGSVTQFVFVNTDDEEHPVYRFMIEADVR
jgi:hypothetical protein